MIWLAEVLEVILMTGWVTKVRERAELLDNQISDLRAQGANQDQLDALSERIKDVRKGFIDTHHGLAWLTGNAISESWSQLHRIEERIDRLTPERQADNLVKAAKRHAEEGAQGKRLKELQQELDKQATMEVKKKTAVEVIEEMHKVAEERHESERNQQRGILYLVAGFFAAAVVMIVVQAAVPTGDRIIPVPSSGATMSSWALLALVMLFGMLGGALSALVSLYMTGKKLTNTVWFDPRPALSVVKVVTGLWTAVLGVLAVGTGVVVGIYTSLASVLLLAFIFGYGQQAVTLFIDRKVHDIVGAEKD